MSDINPQIASTSGPPAQFSILQDNQVLHRKKYGDMCDNYHKLHVKAEETTSDPRLLVLLEFFWELYLRSRDMFNEIFPGLLHDDLHDMFKKIRSILMSGNDNIGSRRVLTRSLSVGSQRARSIGGDEPVRPERFKVKTVVPGGGGGGAGAGGGGGGQGNVKASGGGGGSKSK